jgi:flagellar hook-associated protein 2
MGISLSTGLATGIDYTSLISSLMGLERAPENVLSSKKDTLNKKISVLQTIQTKLSSLQTLAAGMNTADTFMSKSASASDPTVAKVSTESSALPGTHQIRISALAQSQIQASEGYVDKTDTTAFAAGTFTFTSTKPDATPVTVTLTESTSLEGLASAINGAKAGVTASILNDGSGTPYRLVITGNDSYESTFDFTGYSTPPVLSETQSARMASFSVDGIPVTKETNTITDVIPGVTFSLLQGPAEGAAPGTTKDFFLTVTNDVDSVKKKITDFVTSYNAIMFELKGQSDYNTTTNSGGTLSGDSTLRTVQTQLQNILSTPVSGVTGNYSILSSIGIATQRDGSLKVDDATLTEALNNNFNDVVDLFTHNSGVKDLQSQQYGISEQFNIVLKKLSGSYIGPTSDDNGVVATSINGLKNSLSDIDEQIAAMELRLDKKEETLKKQFSAMETLVSSIQTQGNAMISMLQNMSTWL